MSTEISKDLADRIPVEPARVAGGMRVAGHSEHRPSESRPKEGTLAAQLLEKQEKAIIANDAKALSDQLFEVDEQERQQRTGTGKGVASTFAPPPVHKATYSPPVMQPRGLNQPGGAHGCNRY